MDLDLSFDLSPSRVRITPRSEVLLPAEAVSTRSPAHEPPLERLSKDASALSEDLDELRSRIKRADVCKLYPDVQPGVSQLMISPTANPALSAIASSVLNDKVQSVRNDLASETHARLSGDDVNSRRLLRLEQKYNELDIRLRVVELERSTSKKELGDALKMVKEEIAVVQKDATSDLTSKLKEEIEEVKKDLEQKMTKDSTFREEIQRIKKETENALKHKFDEEMNRVRKEFEAGHRQPGSGKLDKITEEIRLYGTVYDEDDFRILQANREKAKLLLQKRRYEEAEEVQKWIWQKCQKKFGEEDRMTIEAHHELATTLQLQEKFEEAEQHARDVLDKAKTYLAEDHPLTLAAMQNLALTLWLLKRHAEAQALYKEALPRYQTVHEDSVVQDLMKKIERIESQKNPEEIDRAPGGSSDEKPKHVMLSGRFNSEEKINYMKKVKTSLEKQGIPTYMVESQIGEQFSGGTMFGLYHAKAMVVFGTADYGAKTGAGYETFYELQFAHENKLHLIPIQLCQTWPPAPTDNDKGEAGKIQNKFILSSTLIKENDEKMEKADEMAEKIAESVRRFDKSGSTKRVQNEDRDTSSQDTLDLKKLETRVNKASENLVVEKVEAAKSNLKEELREVMESEMKEKFHAFTTKASKESEDNKRKMDEKSGELDKVVNGFTSDFKDFKAKLETKADSTRLNQEINQVQTEIQRERDKREVLDTETRDFKARLVPIESRINEVELAEKQTKELVQRNAREMEAERQKAREETKREARELEANMQDEMKKRVKGLEEKLQSTLDGKAELVKLQQLQSDLLSRSEEKEQKLRQDLQREIRACSEESQDKTEKVKKEMKDQVGQVESKVESFIRILKGSATQIVAA